jgi:hypothetical protein
MILECIRDYVSRYGRSPKKGEIASAIGYSESTVGWHVDLLESKGKLERGLRFRYIRLCEPEPEGHSLPQKPIC